MSRRSHSLCDARDCAGLPLVTVSQRDELKSFKLLEAHDSQEGEIAYSTIGNFRETRPVKHRDSNVNLKEQPFESPEAGEAGGQHVTYSTV
ncbi:hypothetical protein NHX12_002071 [Muraenolepis orangiensis]|uniref:Uncharacterized protein n=1 Tax=Muraenolepis orangiensis TaxID=630683 RepID=A0A9Q0E5U4_9TELE|nr:hypothetical protein NHX12_002071 [Muraenolepis orangiensis]